MVGQHNTTPTSGDVFTAAYDAAGNETGRARYTASTANVPVAVAGDDDTLYVASYTWISGARSPDWAILAYGRLGASS